MMPHLPGDVTRPGVPPVRQHQGGPVIDWRAFRTDGRACCCPAKPAVVAVMAPVPGRDHATELLLGGHHRQVPRKALAAAGAVVVDGRARPEEAIPA